MNVQQNRILPNQITTLIGRIVQNHRDRFAPMTPTQQPEHLANRCRIDIRFIHHRQQLLRHRIVRTQHIVTLATTRCPNEHPRKTPQSHQKTRAPNKVSRVHEIQM